MPDRFIESHIRTLPLFAKIPPAAFSFITEAFRVMRVEPGEYLFRQGDVTQGLVMFVTGQAQLIRTTDQGQQVIGIVNANQYINEVALYKESRETASLFITQSATVLFLSRKSLRDVIAHHPEIKEYIPLPLPTVQQQKREKLFNGQRDNETVLLDTRRHWYAYFSRVWLSGVIFMVILVLSLVFLPSGFLMLLIVGVSFLLVLALDVYLYLEWRNDHVIVTDQRLIRIERVIHSFQVSISEVPLSSVHEINADNTTDPLSRVFNYGTVELKTAGDSGNLKLTKMPNPEYIQNLIFQQLSRQKELAERDQRNVIRAEVDKVIGKQTGSAPEDNQGQTDAAAPPVKRQIGPLATRFTNDDGATVYRKHLSIWFRAALWPLLALTIAVVLFFGSFFTLDSLGAVGPIFGFFIFLIGGLWLYWVDWDWRNDIYVVGARTIQLIHKRPLWLQSESDQVLLDSVDNVVSERGGLLQSLLDYGNVRISLIGGDQGGEKVFRAVPNPQAVQAEITRRQAWLRRLEKEEDERRRRDEIADYLSVYHETVNQGGQYPAPSTPGPNPGQVLRPPQEPIDPQVGQPGFPPTKQPGDRMRPPHIPRRRE